MALVMKQLSISFKQNMTNLRVQLKLIMEKMSQVSFTERHGTSLELEPIKPSLVAGLILLDGLMKEKATREFSVESSQMLERKLQRSDSQKMKSLFEDGII